ncbi:MAG: alpha/beta hydrolase [Oscillospiraceae bacterium]|nr:alpha/beta hydrolase [Oscillospiraceae bacterium]
MKKRIISLLACILVFAIVFGVGASAAVITTGLPDGLDESCYAGTSAGRIVVEEEVPGAEVIYDLPYCGDNSTSYQKLHLVLPEEQGEEKLPVLIVVHGGVWSSGNSEEDHRVQITDRAGLHALKYGYAVALVDYSIRNKEYEVALPNQFYEIKAAVRFLRSIAEEYNLDADRVALLGESAGGHLCNMVGVTNGEAEYDLEELGNIEFSSEVQAVIGQYSLCDLKNENDSMLTRLCGVDVATMEKKERNALIASISPISHVDETDPPFYLEHGLADKTVSYTQSCDLYNALIEAGNNKSELHLYPGMDHGVAWFQSEENAEGFLTWLNNLFGIET